MSDDDDLLADLRRVAAEADPVPEVVAASARAAFATRRLDEELLELLQDSDLATTTTTRGPTDGPRLLSYEWADVSLELQVQRATDGLLLRGVVVGTVGTVEVETASGPPAQGTPDEHGWFSVPVPRGPFRVRVTATNGTRVSTSWISP